MSAENTTPKSRFPSSDAIAAAGGTVAGVAAVFNPVAGAVLGAGAGMAACIARLREERARNAEMADLKQRLGALSDRFNAAFPPAPARRAAFAPAPAPA